MKQRENYSPPQSFPKFSSKLATADQINQQIGEALIKYKDISNPPQKKYLYCSDGILLRQNQTFVSPNQNLVGRANPNTKIAPVVIAPSHALDYWKDNDLTVHSSTNDQTTQDVWQSGYVVSNCCGNYNDKRIEPVSRDFMDVCKKPQISVDRAGDVIDDLFPQNKIEGFQHNGTLIEGFEFPPEPTECKNIAPRHDPSLNGNGEKRMAPMGTVINMDMFPHPHLYPGYKSVERVKNERILQPGSVNLSCGYNPSQICGANLPSNYPASNCQKIPEMKEYNKNLFTSIIQPGVYMRNELTEPVSSNIGISFNQQFEPQTCELTSGDEVLYTNYDPRTVIPTPVKRVSPYTENPREDTVYDPRLSGYGTSYRSYIDKMTGQPRFYYDDVDAIRRPDYIVRSKIDHMTEAEHYGPMRPNNEIFQSNDGMRALANDDFMRNSVYQRTDLSSRLMRKDSVERSWQRKSAPMSRGQTYRFKSG